MEISESTRFNYMVYQTAIAALKRIERKRAGFLHMANLKDNCDCPMCIAKHALEDMRAMFMEDMRKR